MSNSNAFAVYPDAERRRGERTSRPLGRATARLSPRMSGRDVRSPHHWVGDELPENENFAIATPRKNCFTFVSTGPTEPF